MSSTSTAAAVIALHTTATILVFPAGGHFLVTHGPHAWAFGNASDALQDAHWLGRNTGKPVRVCKGKKNG